jgi:hypothetical protein
LPEIDIVLQIILDVRSAAAGTAAFRVRDPDGPMAPHGREPGVKQG